MSNTIDQRVVEMRFDNAHFEKNVSTTMSTLDKLKQKLNLSGATKGLDDMNAAAKNNNMGVLGGAVEAVSAKFSALQVMGITALANITNSAVNAGKRIVKSLTIDPIKSGFEEYETKMGSIQTILANTEHQGTTMNDVTDALEKLNLYADKTIYNFQQMTRNIGTFTAAGVDLDTSVKSIQGIANLAAVSGSTSQQASTAMYQLSQALATGTVRLMDWNSVVNAGMGGKVFQNALIRTAAVLDGASADVDAWQKENIDAFGSFRDSLTQGGWLTTEVLTKTLEQFTMAAEEGSEEWENFKKSLMSSGYTEKQAEEILKMANTATDAATKVKTFTQLMDTLKESAQSGWAQTWELIVGDFEEAKAFFTELSDLFGGIIGESSNRRNNFLGDALGSNWDKLISKIGEAGIEATKFEESIEKVVGEKKVEALTLEFGSLEKAVRAGAISSDVLKKALAGVAGTGADGKLASFVDGLKEIERMLGQGNVGEDVKKLQTALEQLGYDLGEPGIDGIIGPITEKAIKEFQKANGLLVDGIVGPETMKALEKAGEKVEETTGDVNDLVDSCGDLIDVITAKSGRELILDSLMNVIKAIKRPLSAVGEAFRNIFAISPRQLYNALEKINKFTKKLVPKGILEIKTWDALTKKINKFGIKTDKFTSKLTETLKDHGVDVDGLIKQYGSLGKAFEDGAISFEYIKEALLSFDGITESLLEGGETADKVRRTFEGFFAIFDLIATVVSGPAKLAFSVITEVLGRMGLTILDITAKIGDGIVKFRDNVDKVIGSISKFIVDNVSKWIEKFKETEFFKTIAGWFESASERISNAVDNIYGRIENFKMSNFGQKLSGIGAFFSGVASVIADSGLFDGIIDAAIWSFEKIKSFFGKFKLPEFNLDNLKNFTNKFKQITEKISGTGVEGFTGTITGLFQHLKDNVLVWNWDEFKNAALEKFTAFWLKTGDKVKAAFDKVKEVVSSIAKFIFGTDELTLPIIVNAATKFLEIIVLIKALQTLNALISPFDNITSALDNLAGSLKWNAIAGMFKSMALAIGVFAICIIVLTNIGDMGKAWQAVGMMILLMAVMGGIVLGLTILMKGLDSGFNATGAALALLAFVGAIAILVYVVKQIDELTLNNPGQTFLTLIATMLLLAWGLKIVTKAGGTSLANAAAILTMMAALKMLLDIIDAYDKYDWTGKGDAILKVADMLGMLALAIRLAAGKGGGSTGMALTLLAMVISLKMLVGIIEDYAAMDDATLKRGIGVVLILLVAMTIMGMALVEANNSNKVLGKGEKMANSFNGLAVALLAVVAAIWLLGKMDIETLTQGGRAVAQALILMAGLLFVVGRSCSGLKMGPIVAMLIAFGVLFAELYFIIKDLDSVSWQSKVSSMVALGGLLLAMAFALKTLTKYDVSSGNLYNWLAAMGLLSLIVMGLGHVLKQMDGIDPIGAIANAAALGILLGAMAGALYVLSTVKAIDLGSGLTVVAGLVVLTLVIGALAHVLKQMNGIDPVGAVANATALGILLGVMTGVIAVMAAFSTILTASIGGFAVAVVGMAVLTLLVAGLAFVLASMNGIDSGNAIGNATALSILLTVMTGVIAVMAAFSTILTATMAGFGVAVVGMAALALVICVLAEVLFAMDSIDSSNAIGNAIALSTLLLAMGVTLGVITLVGLAAPAAGAGLGLLAAFIVEMLFFVGLCSGIDTAALEKGVNNLKIVGRGCGEMIAEFASGLVSTLPDIGTKLSEFATNVQGFVNTIGGTDDGFSSKVTALVEAVAKLVEASFLDALNPFNDGTMGTLGTKLTEFATNASTFMTTIGGMNADAAASLTAFTDAVSTLNELCGDNNFDDTSMETFATSINSFADNIVDVADKLAEISDEDVANVRRAADAGTALSDLNKSLPKTGGMWQDIAGEQDIATWGTKISAFADSLLAVSYKLSGNSIDVDAIKSAASAATSISDLNNGIPKAGGIWEDIAGKQDLVDWGGKIVAFADSLIAYSGKISGANIDSEAIRNSADAVSALADVNAKIPTSGGLWEAIAGGKDISSFGSGFSQLAVGLLAYSRTAAKVAEDGNAVTNIQNTGATIDALAEVVEKLPASGGEWGQLWGEKDPASFASGVTSLANAVVQVQSSAKLVDEGLGDLITDRLSSPIESLKMIVDDVPEIDTTNIMTFHTAVTYLKTVCDKLHTMSTTEYDFSGMEELKTALDGVIGIFSNDSYYSSFEKVATLQSVANGVNTVANTLAGLAGKNYSGVDSLVGNLEALSKAKVDDVIATFSGKAAQIKLGVESVVSALTEGFSGSSDTVTSGAEAVVTNAADAIKARANDFKISGKQLMQSLCAGLIENIKTAKNSGESLGDNAASGAKSSKDSMKTAGNDLGQGLVNGIRDKWDAVWSAGYSLGRAAVLGEQAGQQSNSPSKATIKAGKWLGEGLIIGIERMGKSVYSAGKSMGQTAVGSISRSIHTISDTINSDIDAQPTIRPVLDLSDIRAGAGAIGSMLGIGSTVGVRANVSAISSMMNSRSQNGANAEVVSAIDKLRKDIGNLSNTSYQVNGVTYDDGSNIADAVKAITRAAIRERRI